MAETVPLDAPASTSSRAAERLADRMASWPVEAPIVIAFLFLLLGRLDSGALPAIWPRAWWALFWVGPTLYIALWAHAGVRDHRTGRWAAALPPLVFVGMCLVERYFGRTRYSPWWLTHLLTALGLFATAQWLNRGAGLPVLRNKIRALILGAFLLPLLPLSVAQGLWKDSWRLRIGSDLAAVFDVLQDQYVLDSHTTNGTPRSLIRDQALSDWSEYDDITIGSADRNADVVYLEFEKGRLVSFLMSFD